MPVKPVGRKPRRSKEHAIEVLADGTIRRIRWQEAKTAIRDKTGEYCCDNGNFGQKHKCQKSNPERSEGI